MSRNRRRYNKPVSKTYNHQVELIEYQTTQDEIGQIIQEPIYKKRLCHVESITRNEYYESKKVGLNPTFLILMNEYEYTGETELRYEDRDYKIIKTYQVGNEVELTCELITHDKS